MCSRGWPVLLNQLPVLPSPALVLRSALVGFEMLSRLAHALSASCGTACGDHLSSVGHQRTVSASPTSFFTRWRLLRTGTLKIISMADARLILTLWKNRVVATTHSTL